MKTTLVVVVGLLVITAGGCVAPVVPGADTSDAQAVVFRAEATSVVPKEGDALALEEARLAAATMAKANLLEKLKGATVTSRVEVDGLMFQGQKTTLAVDGFLARATVTYAPGPKEGPVKTVTAIATLQLSPREAGRLTRYAE